MKHAERMADVIRRAGGKVTDGPVDAAWKQGWAVHPFVGRREKRAHWWTEANYPNDRGERVWVAACCIDTITTPRVPLLHAGSIEHCRRCDAAILKQVSRWPR